MDRVSNTSLTNLESKALKKLFDEIDTSHDSRIQVSELQEAMKKGGLDASTRDVYRIIVSADKDADGQIDFQELEEWIAFQRLREDKKMRFSIHLDDQMVSLVKKYKLEDKETEQLKPNITRTTSSCHNFDEVTHAKIRIIFNESRGEGTALDMFQFMDALKRTGNFSQSEMCTLVAKADQDGDAAIDFNEFITMLWADQDRLTLILPNKSSELADEKTSSVKLTLPEIPEDHTVKLSIKLEKPQENEMDASSAAEEMDASSAAQLEVIVTSDEKLDLAEEEETMEFPELYEVKWFADLPRETQSSILVNGRSWLEELEAQEVNDDEKLDLITRLLAILRSEDNKQKLDGVILSLN